LISPLFRATANIFYLNYFTVDGSGNLYFSDGDNNLYVSGQRRKSAFQD
jgi:hypothetical protein